METLKIEKCDRDTAADLLIFAGELKAYRDGVRAGKHDDDAYVVTLARHRIAERERNAGIADHYNFGPENTERDNARNATSQIIAQAIRAASDD